MYIHRFIKDLTLTATMALIVVASTAGSGFGEEVPVVTDQAGRRIAVNRPFSRIISLYGAHTENLFALGLDGAVIGVSKNESHPPRALEKPVFSYHDDPERFLAARPDLVIIRPMIDRGYPKLIARLEKSRIRVISLQPGTIREMFDYWETLGILTGRRPQALDMVRRFKEAVAAFRRLSAPIPVKKRVYFEAIHNKMKTFTPESMAIFALETAGGINVANDALQVRKTNIAFYGKERILSKARQIDVYIAQKGAMNQPTVSLIENESGFHVIRAVKNSQIHIIDEMIISRPTLRLLEGIFHIGRQLYPDLFDGQAGSILKEAGVSKDLS